MGKLLKCHLKGKHLYGQYIDYSEKKNGPMGFICPYTGTIFYNIRIYSRSQVSVYRTIGPLVTINGHGGHLGHVTWTIYMYINFRSPFLRMLHMKFGFDWPSGFRGEDL